MSRPSLFIYIGYRKWRDKPAVSLFFVLIAKWNKINVIDRKFQIKRHLKWFPNSNEIRIYFFIKILSVKGNAFENLRWKKAIGTQLKN